MNSIDIVALEQKIKSLENEPPPKPRPKNVDGQLILIG